MSNCHQGHFVDSEKVNKKHLKGSQALEEVTGISMFPKHIPRCQYHIATQTETISSHKVKGYSGNIMNYLIWNALSYYPLSLCS